MMVSDVWQLIIKLRKVIKKVVTKLTRKTLQDTDCQADVDFNKRTQERETSQAKD